MLIRVTDATEWNGNGVKMPRKYEKFKPPFDFVQKKWITWRFAKKPRTIYLLLKKKNSQKTIPWKYNTLNKLASKID